MLFYFLLSKETDLMEEEMSVEQKVENHCEMMIRIHLRRPATKVRHLQICNESLVR